MNKIQITGDPGLDSGEATPWLYLSAFRGWPRHFTPRKDDSFANIDALYSLDRLQGKGFVSPAAAAPRESSLVPCCTYK
jgi:hypothetical protein